METSLEIIGLLLLAVMEVPILATIGFFMALLTVYITLLLAIRAID